MKYLSMILAALLPLTLSAQTKLSDLIEGTTIVATDLIPFVDVSDTTQAASGSTKKAQAGVLASQLAQLISPTWNNAGTDFTALKVNVTNTASGSGSKLLDLQVGGSSKTSISKTGIVTAEGIIITSASYGSILTGGIKDSSGTPSTSVGWNAGVVQVANNGRIGFSSTSDASSGAFNAVLHSPSAGILAQRNGTNPQESRLYNTYDGTNDEWFSAKWDSNVLKLGTYASGTGTQRNVEVFGLSSLTAQNGVNLSVVCQGSQRIYIGSGFGGQLNVNSGEGITIPGDLAFRFTDDSTSYGTVSQIIRRGTASPESSITANPGSVYLRNNSGTGELWLKTSGTGNTGWTQITIP